MRTYEIVCRPDADGDLWTWRVLDAGTGEELARGQDATPRDARNSARLAIDDLSASAGR